MIITVRSSKEMRGSIRLKPFLRRLSHKKNRQIWKDHIRNLDNYEEFEYDFPTDEMYHYR